MPKRSMESATGYCLMRNPTEYDEARGTSMAALRIISLGSIFGLLDETKRLIPEPILSHRVACIAISCM